MKRKFFACVIVFMFMFGAVPVFGAQGKDLVRDLFKTVINEAAKSSKNSAPQKNNTHSQAAKSNNSQPQSFSKQEDERLIYISGRLESDLLELGDSILAYNKPALDVKLTKKERTVRDLDDYDEEGPIPVQPVMYSRVCVKNRTIVIGTAEKDKKFTTAFIITGDTDFPPEGKNWGNPQDLPRVPRIYVGENINVLENFVGLSASNISKIQQQENGIINLDPTSFVFTNLAYKDGKITELHHHNGYSLIGQKAWNFAKKKAQELGFVLVSQF